MDEEILLVSETYVNRDLGARFGGSEPYEPYTNDLGQLYKDFRKEYGRCTGKVYCEQKEAGDIAIGWVFVKRAKYTDCDKTYLQETWVTLYDAHKTDGKGFYPRPEFQDIHYHVLK